MLSAPTQLFASRGSLKAGLLAVALGAAVLITSPIISPAPESLEPPSSYYQDLEAYLASPEAGRDTSVSIASEELGLVPSSDSF